MPQPVDLQNVLSKTQAAEKVSKLEKAHPDVAQQQSEASMKEKIRNKNQRVQNPDKSDEVIIHKDGEGKEDSRKRKKKKKKENEEYELFQEDGEKRVKTKHVDLLA